MKQVAAALIEHEDRILVAQRPPGDPLEGQWEFPGGSLEPGESPIECLHREIMEELGMQIEVGSFVAASRMRYSHDAIELHGYRARVTSGEPTARVHAEVRWIPRSLLCELTFCEADRPIVAAYLAATDERE